MVRALHDLKLLNAYEHNMGSILRGYTGLFYHSTQLHLPIIYMLGFLRYC